LKKNGDADKLHVTHILEAGERIAQYLQGVTKDTFLFDTLRQDAVVRNFQVLGEAAKRISDATRKAHPDVPWREFAGFRDVLIHRYDEIVPSDVWQVATEDLPAAMAALRAVATQRKWL
jgi:uncharacterized protein with HEPN domain